MVSPFAGYDDERRYRLMAQVDALTPEQRARLEERLGLRPSNPFERYVTAPLARFGRAARHILPAADPADVADMQAPGGLPDAVQAPFVSFLPRSFETGAPEPLQPAARVIRGTVSPGGIATLGLGGARAGALSVGGSIAGATAGAPFGPTGETIGSVVGGFMPGARAASPRGAMGIVPGVPEEIVGGQAARTPRHVQEAARAAELRQLAEDTRPMQGTLGNPGEAIPGTGVAAPVSPPRIDAERIAREIADIEAGAPSPFRQFEPGAGSPEAMEMAFGRQRPVDAAPFEDAYGGVRPSQYRALPDFERSYGRPEVHYPTRPESDLPVIDEFGSDAYGAGAVQQERNPFGAFAEDPYGPVPPVRSRATPPDFETAYGARTGRADISPLEDIIGTRLGPGPLLRSPLEEIYGPYAGEVPPGAPPRPTPKPPTTIYDEFAGKEPLKPSPPYDPYAAAETGAPPPAEPPVPVATGGVTPPTPPASPAAAMPPEAARSIELARAMRAQDEPGKISKLVIRGPLRRARDAWTPARAMPEQIHVGQMAENSASAKVDQELFASRMPLLRKIDELFGPGVRNGAQANVPFKGTAEQAANELTGTFKDIADYGPELYDLNPAQQQFLGDFDTRNTGAVNAVNMGYGSDIGLFKPKPGGAFLSTIDRSEEALAATEAYYGQGTGPRAVASGRMQPRVFQTARERMAADPSFKPNTDVAELLRGMDRSKAQAAGGETLRWAVGGLEKEPTGSATAHGYKQVDLGGGERRWFPPDEAAHLERIKKQAARTGLLRFAADVQATVLAEDFSPFTIQGQQAALFEPDGFVRAMASGKVRWTPDSIAELIAKDPQSWGDYAAATGRSLTEPTPGEFGTGLLGRIPKLGPLLTEANTRMYNLVQVLLKQDFDEEVARQVAKGETHANAMAIAADYIQRIVPQTNPTRYGLSAKQAQLRRLPLTSVSFVQKSAELLADATRGFGKIATAGQIAKMTPREKLAVTRVTRSAAILGTISVASAVLEAERTGQDPIQAAKDAINPAKPQVLSLVAFGHRVPLGGPLRALFVAMYPRELEGSPVPVPFAGMARYLENRIQPAISTGLHSYANRDYQGHAIFRKGYDNAFVTAGKIGAYIAENMTPASVQSSVQSVRGAPGNTVREQVRNAINPETAIQVGGQVLGQNVQKYRTISDLKRDWAKDFKPYKELPANPREARTEGVQTRDRYLTAHPQVEAQLFITGEVDSLSTSPAKFEAIRLMKENRLRLGDIRSLEPRDYDSVEHRALRRFFAVQMGEPYVEGKLAIGTSSGRGPLR